VAGVVDSGDLTISGIGEFNVLNTSVTQQAVTALAGGEAWVGVYLTDSRDDVLTPPATEPASVWLLTVPAVWLIGRRRKPMER
jgi:hypothetical protein